MGYYNNYTSAHRNGYYVSGVEYNKMQMQAEMTAEAYAKQLNTATSEIHVDHVKPATDWAYQVMWKAGIPITNDPITELNRSRARKQQPMYLQMLDNVINKRVQVANIPENRDEALAVCQYIKENNKYPTPWGNTTLTSNYRNLLQAFLDRAGADKINSLTNACVNEWIAQCRLLRTKVDTVDAVEWETEFESLVEM